MGQRCAYTALTEAELQFAVQALERDGIRYMVPMGSSFPTFGMPLQLFVDEDDLERSVEALRMLGVPGLKGERPCPACGAPVALELEECWSCQADMTPASGS